MRHELYICTSLYQVFNCLSIAKGNSVGNIRHLLILDYGSGILKKLNIESLKRVFSKVISRKICKMTESVYKRYLFYFREIISLKPYGLNIKKHYDDIYISGTEMHSKIIAMQYVKGGADLHYIEDGLGTYDGVLNAKTKYKQDTILKIFYGKRALDICKDLYVYKPNLVINNTFGIPIKQINNINKFCSFTEIESFFKEKSSDFSRRFVFLSGWFKEDDMYEEQRKYVEVLKEIAPFDYCIKPHPNETRIIDIDNELNENCGIFEVANLLFDMSDHVFVSIISTACLTPKMLYDKKPVVIFLYKIFQLKFNIPEWNETDKVIRRIIEQEDYESKVFIPESIEEYISMVNNLVLRSRDNG